MEIYGTGLGLQNRYDALILDNSVDPLEAISKTAKKPSKKLKAKKDAQSKSKEKSEQAKTKSKDPQAKKSEKSDKSTDKPAAKPTAKPTKPGKPAIAEPEKPLEVPFERLLTLDEYREANRANLRRAPQYNLRQPGEGEDPSQWEKLVPLEKKKYQEEEGEVEYEASEFQQRAGRQRRLPVRVTFGDSLVRQATTRRDLNAAAVRLAAVAAASPLAGQRQRPPKVDNEREFPTLGN